MYVSACVYVRGTCSQVEIIVPSDYSQDAPRNPSIFSQCRAEMEKVAAEFRSYKVRAHSVLKSDKHKSVAEQSTKQVEDLQAEVRMPDCRSGA